MTLPLPTTDREAWLAVQSFGGEPRRYYWSCYVSLRRNGESPADAWHWVCLSIYMGG